MEEWKDIPNYEGLYKVSTLGSVRSLDKYVNHWRGGTRFVKGCVLNPCKRSKNSPYLAVVLHKNGRKTFNIHSLVGITFLNYKAEKNVIVLDHINEVVTDNRLENLRIISHSENIGRNRGGSMYGAITKVGRKFRLRVMNIHIGMYNCETHAMIVRETLKA